MMTLGPIRSVILDMVHDVVWCMCVVDTEGEWDGDDDDDGCVVYNVVCSDTQCH
jgi:hypothetical protein